MEQNAACAWQLHNGTPMPKERTSRYCSIPLQMQSISPAPRQGRDDLKAGAVWFTGCHHAEKAYCALPAINAVKGNRPSGGKCIGWYEVTVGLGKAAARQINPLSNRHPTAVSSKRSEADLAVVAVAATARSKRASGGERGRIDDHHPHIARQRWRVGAITRHITV